jgi:hypothetical protein
LAPLGSLKGQTKVTQQAALPIDPKPQAATPNGAAPADTPRTSSAITVPKDDALATAADTAERSISAFSGGAAFDTALRMAKALAASTLVPKEYQGNVPNCLIAIELSSRTGASVLMVTQNLYIVHGRPGWGAQFLIGTANTSGRFTPLRFEWCGTKGKPDWGCRAVAKDRKTGEPLEGSWVTMAMANDEGWATKSGSKWKTMPEQMFMYRAGTFWTRVYAPEIGLGMQTREEIIDTTATDVTELPEALVPGSPKALEQALMGSGVIAPVAAPLNVTADGEVIEAKQKSSNADLAAEAKADERAHATK